jgi:hypothetical protein
MKSQKTQEKRIYRKRRKRQLWRKQRNLYLNGLPKEERRLASSNVIGHSVKVIKIRMPEIFSTEINVEQVLEFISKCKKIEISKNEVLFLDFHKNKNVNAGALALLLSLVQDLTDLKIRIKGNLPSDRNARKEFIDSGFLEYFYDNHGKRAATKNKILVKGKHTTDQVRTAQEIQKAMYTVFGLQSYNQLIQGAIIEMMANSLNHAFPGNASKTTWFFDSIRQNKRWYLSVYHDVVKKKVFFSFIDNGIGILKTIRIGSFQKIVNLLSDDQVLKNAFDGAYQSSTKRKERGRGLSTVKDAFEKGAIKELRVLTNDRLYSFENQQNIKLTNSFEGTVYFWVLDEKCKYGGIIN